MRTYYLVLLGMLAVSLANAQSQPTLESADWLQKGQLNVGVRVGQGYRGTYPRTDYLAPQIQYFIADRWSVSAEGRYLTSRIYNPRDYRLLGGGASTRYYFVRGKRLALFAHGGATYGRSTFRLADDAPDFTVTKSNVWQYDAGIGVLYRLNRRFSIEVMGSRSWLSNSIVANGFYQVPADINRWQVSVGVIYRIW